MAKYLFLYRQPNLIDQVVIRMRYMVNIYSKINLKDNMILHGPFISSKQYLHVVLLQKGWYNLISKNAVRILNLYIIY